MPFYHTAQFSYKMSTVENGHNIWFAYANLQKKNKFHIRRTFF